MFVPVDVPLVPGELLLKWAEDVMGLGKNGMEASFLLSKAGRESAFCMVRRDCSVRVSAEIDHGVRRLDELLLSINVGDSWVEPRALGRYAEFKPSELEVEIWFTNVNTPNDLEVAEAWAKEDKSKSF